MGFSSQSGHARTSSRNPQAFSVCDRCGQWHNFVNLRWQFDWRGASLQNLRILVCKRCYDTPQNQLRAIVLPPDPQPIINARPEIFPNDESDWLTLTPSTIDPTTGLPVPNTTVMALTDGVTQITKVPVGAPLGYRGLERVTGVTEYMTVTPPPSTTKMALVNGSTVMTEVPLVNIPYLSINGNGTTIVNVTCSQAHRLSTNDQIYAEGLSQKNACGMWSITVTTATAFTYTGNTPVVSGSLLTGNEFMVATSMGLPYGYLQIPHTGV